MRTANIEELAQPPTDAEEIGKLIDFADRVPRDLVLSLVARYCEPVKQLIERDGAETPPADLTRRLVVLGTLINRALFEVLDLPQDRNFRIG